MKKRTIDHTELLVLSLLAGEDMYGYQIITELARRSDHTFDMKEGTLYPVLHGLWKDGQVECYEAEAPTGRKRKYYHLTKKGWTRCSPMSRPRGDGHDAGRILRQGAKTPQTGHRRRVAVHPKGDPGPR